MGIAVDCRVHDFRRDERSREREQSEEDKDPSGSSPRPSTNRRIKLETAAGWGTRRCCILETKSGDYRLEVGSVVGVGERQVAGLAAAKWADRGSHIASAVCDRCGFSREHSA